MTANAVELIYENEEKIVWLKDKETLAKMGWANEKIIVCSIRTGPVRSPKGEILVGYSVLRKDTAKDDCGGFRRRIFTRPIENNALCSELSDRLGDNALRTCNIIPERAVDLLSVQPAKPSKILSNPL